MLSKVKLGSVVFVSVSLLACSQSPQSNTEVLAPTSDGAAGSVKSLVEAGLDRVSTDLFSVSDVGSVALKVGEFRSEEGLGFSWTDFSTTGDGSPARVSKAEAVAHCAALVAQLPSEFQASYLAEEAVLWTQNSPTNGDDDRRPFFCVRADEVRPDASGVAPLVVQHLPLLPGSLPASPLGEDSPTSVDSSDSESSGDGAFPVSNGCCSRPRAKGFFEAGSEWVGGFLSSLMNRVSGN